MSDLSIVNGTRARFRFDGFKFDCVVLKLFYDSVKSKPRNFEISDGFLLSNRRIARFT